MSRPIGVVLLLSILALGRLWPLDLRLGMGASVHLAPHPSVGEPLDAPPLVFVTVAVDLTEGDTGLVTELAAGWSSDALDGEMVVAFRHVLGLDWGILSPFIQAGLGWVVRSTPAAAFDATALFPEARIGIEAATPGPVIQATIGYRPAPLPLLLLEERPYPLRRLTAGIGVLWAGSPR